MALALRYAARSDIGLLRSSNQDSGYAGPRLLVVADGMGGHAGGDVASSVTVATLASLDEDPAGPDLLDRLAERMGEANDRLREITEDEPGLSGMGTTVTAILRAGSRLGLAHVGDSRCYLLREGELTQITRDHSFVQTLVDEGRLSAEDAAHHPQKNWITRVLDGRDHLEIDLSVREAHAGDRYLLCSDGLSGVVSEDTLRETLADPDIERVVKRLIDLALRGGGPDNITCIVADVVEVASGPPPAVPIVLGAASDRDTVHTPDGAPSAAAKAAALARRHNRHGADDPRPADDADPRPSHWLRRTLLAVVVLALLAAGAWWAWSWSQKQYFVSADKGQVTIYRGLSQALGPLQLSSVYRREDVALTDLPVYSRQRVQDSIDAKDLRDAERIVSDLRAQAAECRAQAAAPTPAATTGATPTPRATPSPGATPGATPAATAGPTAGALATAPSPNATAIRRTVDCGGSGS